MFSSVNFSKAPQWAFFLATFVLNLLLCTTPLYAASNPAVARVLNTPLTTLEGQTTTLASTEKKAMVINLWARWCSPCKEEIPLLNSQVQAFKNKGATLIGLALEDDFKGVKQFTLEKKMAYPVFLLPVADITLFNPLGNEKRAVPFTVVINAQGEVVYQKMGLLRQSDIDAMLKALP